MDKPDSEYEIHYDDASKGYDITAKIYKSPRGKIRVELESYGEWLIVDPNDLLNIADFVRRYMEKQLNE